jgi:hypothetical protein
MINHRHIASGGVSKIINSSFFGGLHMIEEQRAITYYSKGEKSEFTVQIDPDNHGVVLSRIYDQGIWPTSAELSVDSIVVGIWYEAGINPHHRFAEDSYLIPKRLTAGKSFIRVSLKVMEGDYWTECHYRVSCMKKSPMISHFIDGCVYVLESPHNDKIRSIPFRLIRIQDDTCFIVNNKDGSVIADQSGQLEGETVSESFGLRSRWIPRERKGRWAFQNASTSHWLNVRADRTIIVTLDEIYWNLSIVSKRTKLDL